MGNLFVRKVKDDTIASLKRKAKAAGKSVNDLVRETLDAAAKPNREEAWAAADRLRTKIRARVGHDLPDSTPRIREDRDSR